VIQEMGRKSRLSEFVYPISLGATRAAKLLEFKAVADVLTAVYMV
jgi:hypothetical protein